MPITNRTSILQNLFTGKGLFQVYGCASGFSATAGAAASGFFTGQIRPNSIGSALPGTVVGYQTAPGVSEDCFPVLNIHGSSTTVLRGCWLAWVYLLGTVNLAATGDQFTHDAATFPVLRTMFGQASTPVGLLPMIEVTTAPATTAPVMRLRTAGGAAGYTNQAGNTVVATRTMTLPSATTVARSAYYWRLERGDSAVRDVSAVEVTTAGTAGAARIWGIEILGPTYQAIAGGVSAYNSLFNGIFMPSLKPAVATSGTVTAYLVHVDTIGANTQPSGTNIGVYNV